jgi:glycosyltransferase involved in cell wall biosynthesis
MHNIHPHEGEKAVSRVVKRLMYKYANLIIAHSEEAKEYARRLSNKKVVFMHHPVEYHFSPSTSNASKEYDILIWGSIEPYKGVLEFLEYASAHEVTSKILVVGSCKNANYLERIEVAISKAPSIVFDNKRISFEEVGLLIRKSQFVVFPYISKSVSSSGALMDTLRLGGNVIGPNKGAFKDLSKDGICFVFDSFNEVFEIVRSRSKIESSKIDQFLKCNDWPIFVDKLVNEIEQL